MATEGNDEIHCFYCGRLLEQWNFDDDKEGDATWIFPLDDGEGGEGIMCEDCYNKQGEGR
jgi:inhibitor of apoptosis domain-containing protein